MIQRPFREIVAYARGGGWGSESALDDHEKVAIIRGTDFASVRSGRLDAVPRRWEKRSKLPQRVLQSGDVVLEISGGSAARGQTTGRTLFICEEVLSHFSDPVIPASFCRVVRFDTTLVEPRYAYYGLQDMYNSGRAGAYENQSTGISNFQFERFLDGELLRVPPLAEQRRIVTLLGTIDDKIAVNDRAAATALELAEALYLQASSSHDWSSIELGSAASWHSGGTPKTSEPRFWSGEIPWISASSLKGCWIETSERRLTELGAASGTRLVPAGVVIFVVRGSSLKEEFRIGLTQREVAFGQDCKALVPFPGLDPHILFHGIRSARDQVLDLVDETSIGAGRLSTDLITKLAIRVPPETANDVVEEIRSLDRLSAARTSESRVLSALRDALLPELMSGRLRVKDAETLVEEAV